MKNQLKEVSKDMEKVQENREKLRNTKVNEAEIVSGTETVADKKKQKKSVSYALKALKTHLNTLIDNDLLKEGDVVEIKVHLDKATKKYIEREYGL